MKTYDVEPLVITRLSPYNNEISPARVENPKWPQYIILSDKLAIDISRDKIGSVKLFDAYSLALSLTNGAALYEMKELDPLMRQTLFEIVWGIRAQ